jgi:hypothetical protein
MKYQKDLQGALRRRYKRLVATDAWDITHEVRLVTNWIGQQSTLRAILAEAERAEPGLNFEHWEMGLHVPHSGLNWPSRTDAGRASLAWQLMQRVAHDSPPPFGRIGGLVQEYSSAFSLAGGGNIHERAHQFVKRIIGPLIEFLEQQVGAESSVLYVLERYVRRLEWFDRDELYDRYNRETRKGEGIYDTDLRRFLFTEGIDMPFSQAQSASGLSDMLSELDTDDPLVVELKIFDGHGRGKRHLASGVNQAVQYAQDYGKTVAYLVIINLTGRALELPSDGPADTWPPQVEVAGVRIHLIAIRALPTATASKQGKAAPVVVTHADLINKEVARESPGDA